MRSGETGLVAAVAEHFWRGGERSRSLPYLLWAAEEATGVHAYAQRRQSLRPRRRGRGRGGGHRDGGDRRSPPRPRRSPPPASFARALKVYHELLRSGRTSTAPAPTAGSSLSRMNLRKGRLHTRLGEHEAALASHEEGLRDAHRHAPARSRDRSAARQGRGPARPGELGRRVHAARSALRAGRPGGARPPARQPAQHPGQPLRRRGDCPPRRPARSAAASGRPSGPGTRCSRLRLRNNLGNVLLEDRTLRPGARALQPQPGLLRAHQRRLGAALRAQQPRHPGVQPRATGWRPASRSPAASR